MKNIRLFVAGLVILAAACVSAHAANTYIIDDTATFTTGDFAIRVSDNYSETTANTNANYVTFTVGTNDTLLVFTPAVTNQAFRLKNEAGTNSPANFIYIGGDGTNYPVCAKPGEVIFGRLTGPGPLHAHCTTNTAPSHVLALPN